MIRFVNCIKRKADTTPEEFRRFWNDSAFLALIERIADLTRAKRHARNATLVVDANLTVREMRGSREPYDGVLEYWWDSAAHLIELLETSEWKAVQEEMDAYQRQFVDFAGSTAFFTDASD